MRIAILEDEPAQRELLVQTLVNQLGGPETVHCQALGDGKELQRLLRRESFDLVILDWSVPSLDGMELLRWLRTWQDNRVGILMISANGGEQAVADALTAGADDYIVKPFRPLELRARVLRLLKRGAPAAPGRLQTIGRWTLDASRRQINYRAEVDGSVEQHILTSREFRLAQLLFTHMGQTVSRAHLLEAAGYAAEEQGSRTLDSYMYRLRKKLQLDAQRGMGLRTVYGQGYCLDASMGDASG